MSETTQQAQVRLPRTQERRLEDWIVANIDRLKEANATQAEAAEQAAKALGLPRLTPANVRGACKAMDIEWRTRPAAALEARVSVLEDEVAILKLGLATLRSCINTQSEPITATEQPLLPTR